MRLKRILFGSLVLIVLGVPITIIAAFFFSLKDRILPKTYAGGINLSGLTITQTEKAIEEKISKVRPLKIRLSKSALDEPKWELDLEALGLKYQPQKTAEKAFKKSRERFFQNLTKDQKLELDFVIKQDLLEEKLATIAAEVYQAVVPTEISFDHEKKEVIFNQGQEGQELEIEKTKKIILEKIAELDFNQPTELILKKLSRLPSEEQIKDAKERAERLANKVLTLISQQQNFILQNSQLIEFVGLFSKWDQEKISQYVEVLAQSIDRPPQNALFEFKDNQITAFKPDQLGFKLNQKEAVETIGQAIDELTESNSGNATRELPLGEIKPAITASDTNQLGIVALIGQGESWFSHSIPSRIHNLDLASSKIHGQIIAPSEVFSINEVLGDISRATGYRDAYIIKDGKTILGAGGGVCQVSTTLFRAAINSGLPILERHPHAYRVQYYEENYKAGFDAGVFSPSSDLKFKNDTAAHILIQRVFDEKNHYLSFQIYGSPDGRKVEINNIRLWGIAPPPEDLYLDDPTLAAGTIKQVDFKAWGAKVAFDWKVTDKEGKILQEQTFFSNYQPWRAIFSRGTKTN